MSTFTRRTFNRCKAARILAKGGAGLRGTTLYFLRHLLSDSHHQVDLKSGLSIVAPLSEPLVQMFNDIWVKRCYTSADCEIVVGDTVVDIGANVGAFSMYAATRAPDVRVIALEPSPRIFHFLQQNVFRNGLRHVVAVPAACGGESGTAVLYSRGFEGGNSIYSQDNAGRKFNHLAQVEVMTLDDVFRNYSVEVCNLLKLSCVGAEYEILFKASEDTLLRIRKISMEYHLGLNNHTVQEMAEFLECRGYKAVYTPPYDEECGYCYASRRI